MHGGRLNSSREPHPAQGMQVADARIAWVLAVVSEHDQHHTLCGSWFDQNNRLLGQSIQQHTLSMHNIVFEERTRRQKLLTVGCCCCCALAAAHLLLKCTCDAALCISIVTVHSPVAPKTGHWNAGHASERHHHHICLRCLCLVIKATLRAAGCLTAAHTNRTALSNLADSGC
jgi:hypothetical protein